MQRNAPLLFIEIDLILLGDLLLRGRIDKKQPLHDLAADEIGINDLLDVLQLDKPIESILRIDFHKRSLRAEAEAADLIDRDLLRKAALHHKLLKAVADLRRVGRQAARAAAEDDRALAVRAVDLCAERFRTGADLFIQIMRTADHASAPPFARYSAITSATEATLILG